jgi:hypothetical protein
MAQMDARGIGLVAGGGALLAAVAAALFAGPGPAPAPPAAQPPAAVAPENQSPDLAAPDAPSIVLPDALDGAGPAPAAPQVALAPRIVGEPGAQTAPAMEFIVRFKPPHPLAAAQALYAANQREEAMIAARRALRTRKDVAGLCVERFTLSGQEIVLTPCAPAPSARAERHAQRWLAHLRGLNAVEYADPNVVVEPGKSGVSVEGPG